MPERYYWTTPEEALIRRHYPAGGLEAVVPHIPHRTPGAIQGKANRMGCSAPKRSRFPAPRHKHTDQTDAMIRAVYASPDKGEIKRLSERFGWPRETVRNRAAALGIHLPQLREPEWTRAEEEIVIENAHLNPKTIARKLELSGHYPRSRDAVKVRLHRLGIGQRDAMQQAGIYSTHQLGDLLGVSSKVISRDIEKGKLVATKEKPTNDGDPSRTPYRIKESAVRDWIKNHAFEIDLRKAHNHRVWFISMISGR